MLLTHAHVHKSCNCAVERMCSCLIHFFVTVRVFVCAHSQRLFVPLQKPEALHNEWRGGSAAMQTALAGAEHEKALIVPVQLSALKRNMTHTAREAGGNQKHLMCQSFTRRLASAKLLFALEPVSHSVVQCLPKLCFLVEKGECGGKYDVRVGLHLPVRSAWPVYTGCC